jgi:hypothetical protein
MDQPPSGTAPESAPPPSDERYRLRTSDKALFGIVFTLEIILFVGYSGCTLLLSGGMGGMNPFLIPIPVFLICHILAYKGYTQLQTNPTRQARTKMYVFLFAPLVLIAVLLGMVMSMLQGL